MLDELPNDIIGETMDPYIANIFGAVTGTDRLFRRGLIEADLWRPLNVYVCKKIRSRRLLNSLRHSKRRRRL